MHGQQNIKNCSYCVLIVQPTRCNVSQIIYFCKTLYMFQTVFPSIIRSSKLHIQRQVLVWRCMCSFDLLMMDGRTVWNMQSVLKK